MLSQTDVVDLVTRDNGTGTYQLILVVERGEWTLPNVNHLLQEKTNAYLIYAIDGQMFDDYPDAKGVRVEVIIQYLEPPPPSIDIFIDRLKLAVQREGVNIRAIPLSL